MSPQPHEFFQSFQKSGPDMMPSKAIASIPTQKTKWTVQGPSKGNLPQQKIKSIMDKTKMVQGIALDWEYIKIRPSLMKKENS